jgi:hypothetical protein
LPPHVYERRPKLFHAAGGTRRIDRGGVYSVASPAVRPGIPPPRRFGELHTSSAGKASRMSPRTCATRRLPLPTQRPPSFLTGMRPFSQRWYVFRTPQLISPAIFGTPRRHHGHRWSRDQVGWQHEHPTLSGPLLRPDTGDTLRAGRLISGRSTARRFTPLAAAPVPAPHLPHGSTPIVNPKECVCGGS